MDAKQLHSINQNIITMFVSKWKKHPCLVVLFKGITDSLINLNIPNWASQRRPWQGTEKLHQVTQWRKKITLYILLDDTNW